MSILAATVLFMASAERPKVFFFVITECPISRKYSPEMKAIYRDYKGKADFSLVIVEPDITAEKAATFRKDFGYEFGARLDKTGSMAKAAKINIVPTAAVQIGKDYKYIGRIDNRFPTLGTQKPVTRKDLRIALDEVLAGKPVTVSRTEAVGCVLPSSLK